MLIEKDEFRKFLEENLDTEFICGNPCACPLARYLEQLPEVKQVMVHQKSFNFYIKDQLICEKTSKWMQEFITYIDFRRSRIKGRMALEILNAV